MRRWIAVWLCAAVIALPIVATAQEEPPLSLVTQAIDTSAFPRITVSVTLPLELTGGGQAAPAFTVTENGESRQVLAVEPLAAERAPLDVVLLVDTSGSMRGEPIVHARDAAGAFVDMLAPSDEISVVSFASSVAVVSGFTSDKALLRQVIAGLEARGETALYDGIRRSAALLAERGNRDAVIVLLSDGGDTASSGTLDDAVAALEQSGIPLFAVGLETSETDMDVLATLASRARGRLIGVGSSAELADLYGGIARELTTQYQVEFDSAIPSTKDLELVVATESAGRVARVAMIIENPQFRNLTGAGEGTRPASPLVSVILAAGVLMLAFGAVALGSGGLLSMVFRRSGRIEQLHFYDQLSSQSSKHSATRAAGVANVMQEAVASVAGRRGFTKTLHDMLERAGLPLRPVEYMYFHVIGVVVAGAVTQVLTGIVLLSFLVVVLAVALPILLLQNAIDRRRKSFEEQLPEILSLMAGSLRSGWGIQQSIDLVVQEMGDPASAEFRRVQAETRLGLSVEESLEKMADRLGSEDFRWTVTAIAIQRDVGGNLAEVLDILANTMRERAELRRHVDALTSEGRLSAMILYALPFVMAAILLVVNPAYIGPLFATPFGLLLLSSGVVLLVVGAFWLKRATTVEV